MKALIIAGKMHIVSIWVLGALSWQKVRVYQYLQQPADTMVEFKLRPEECGTCVLAARFGIMQTVDTAQPRIEYVTQRQKAQIQQNQLQLHLSGAPLRRVASRPPTA